MALILFYSKLKDRLNKFLSGFLWTNKKWILKNLANLILVDIKLCNYKNIFINIFLYQKKKKKNFIIFFLFLFSKREDWHLNTRIFLLTLLNKMFAKLFKANILSLKKNGKNLIQFMNRNLK
jgi:hypothetical protein